MASLDAKLTLATLESAVAVARRVRTDSSTFGIDDFIAR